MCHLPGKPLDRITPRSHAEITTASQDCAQDSGNAEPTGCASICQCQYLAHHSRLDLLSTQSTTDALRYNFPSI